MAFTLLDTEDAALADPVLLGETRKNQTLTTRFKIKNETGVTINTITIVIGAGLTNLEEEVPESLPNNGEYTFDILVDTKTPGAYSRTVSIDDGAAPVVATLSGTVAKPAVGARTARRRAKR